MPDMKVARSQAWRFVREYEPGMPGLLFHGPTGTGKTHLSIAILLTYLDRGVRAVFREFVHLLRISGPVLRSRANRGAHASPGNRTRLGD